MRIHTTVLLVLAIALGGCQTLSDRNNVLSRSGEAIKTQAQKLADLAANMTGDPQAEARHAEVEALFDQAYIDPLTRYLNNHTDDPDYRDYLPVVRAERDSRCRAIAYRYNSQPATRDSLQRLEAGYAFSCPEVVNEFAKRVPASAASDEHTAAAGSPAAGSPAARSPGVSNTGNTAQTGSSAQAQECYLLFAIRNYQQAESICRTAANAGDAKARHHLAAISNSNGNQTEALRWARLAADQGQANGQLLLAELLKPQAPEEAFGWLQKAAAQQLPEAHYQLAQAYQQGQGTAADPGRAESQLRQAAAAGYLPAMLALGIDKNGTAAGRYWLEQAAERGSAEAQYRLGLDYLRGTGGPEDPQTAYVWLSLSLVNGEQRGKRYLEQLSGQLDSTQLAAARNQIQRRLNSR